MSEHRIDLASTPLRDGEMSRLELDDTAVVLARVEGQYYAFRASCTHYGGPLDKGVLKGHTVMCPWHHACFDIRSGQRTEPPALNNLPRYPLRQDGEQVIITLPHDNATQPQGKADPSDSRTFVIIGGGAAGAAAVEELRSAGFSGQIVMLSAVPDVPVDRPNLSKDYLDGHAKPEWMPLRGTDFYAGLDIQLRLNTRVTGIDAQAHSVSLDNGQTVQYDKLLLASGATPRQLNVPGSDLDGVMTLRSTADSDAIIQAAEANERAVVIGASFIGLEVTAALVSGRDVSVTVVAPEAVPFDRILGDDIGRALQKAHENNGVQFRLNSEVQRFVGENGRVSGVELKSGETLPADFVVVGIGVNPATDFLQQSGLRLRQADGSVRVNARLQTSDPDIYAAGDIARWDDGSADGLRIEHWRVAQQHGMVAARNMLGEQEDINAHVPFFWTNQWGFNLRYVGNAAAWDDIIFRGAPADDNGFVAFYVANGQLQAAAGRSRDPEMCAIEFILQDRLPLTPEQMRDADFDLVAHVGRSG